MPDTLPPLPAASLRPPAPSGLTRLWCNGPLLLALCMAFWAGSIVTGRAAAAEVPPALFTLLRWAGALLLALPFGWRHLRRDWPALRARWWLPLLLGMLGVVTYNSLVYKGLHDTTATNALLLQSASPLLMLVAVFVMFRERPRPVQVVAILVSLAGVLVIAAQGSFAVLRAMRFNPGDVLVLIAVAAYSVYTAALRLRPAVHPISLMLAMMIAGISTLLPLAWLEHAHGAHLILTPLSVSCLVYAAVFPAFLAYLFYNRGVELSGVARAGQFTHLVPVFGVLLAAAALGERLQPYHGVGIALIAAGLWLADRRRGGPELSARVRGC